MHDSYTKLELAVGAFVIAGCAALAYLALSLGGLPLGRSGYYAVHAPFSSIGDLKLGDPVKIAGVSVGKVEAIELVDYVAQVELSIRHGVRLPEDTLASIQAVGILGDAVVALSPGASDRELAEGATIVRTESAVSLMELISKYAFGSPLDDAPSVPSGGNTNPAPSKTRRPFDDPLE